jgi:acyl carrier protein
MNATKAALDSEFCMGSQLHKVREWLLDYRPKLKETPDVVLDLDLDLIESRVIDSLGFMNFVFFLEELTGRELIAEAQSANSFRTLRIIQQKILESGT